MAYLQILPSMLVYTRSKPFLEPTGTKLDETMWFFDMFRTHAWQAFTDYESDALTSVQGRPCVSCLDHVLRSMVSGC